MSYILKLIVFILMGVGFYFVQFAPGQISTVTLPNVINDSTIPKVIYVDQNDNALLNGTNELKDTVNTYLQNGILGTKLLSSTDWDIKIDKDSNSTSVFSITHHTSDTLFKVSEDSSVDIYNKVNNNLTVEDTIISPVANIDGIESDGGAFVFNTTGVVLLNNDLRCIQSSTYTTTTRPGIFVRSSNTSGDGNYGGSITLGQSLYSTNNAGGASIVSFQDGADVNYTGLKFLVHSGSLVSDPRTIALTIGSSGNILISNLTASQAVFTDGSKNLVSNAITGTGNVVMSAGATLTGEITVDTLTADSINTGNENFGYDEGLFEVTAQGFSSDPTDTVYYSRLNKTVTLYFTSLAATSDSAGLSVGTIPADLRVPAQQRCSAIGLNGGGEQILGGLIKTDGTIAFKGDSTFTGAELRADGFKRSGSKGIQNVTITYMLYDYYSP